MQEIRDRLTTLETRTEERHIQNQSTMTRIADAVETIANHQSRLTHIGEKLDQVDAIVASDHDRLNTIEVKQGVIWKALGVIGSVLTGLVITAAFKMWGS